MPETLDAWMSYLNTWPDADHISTEDALGLAISTRVDDLDATDLDVVAYHEISACASLDDEIDSADRW